jgi:hypothetical protein
MKTEDEVVLSPLSRTMDMGGRSMEIHIFRGTRDDDDWMLEVIDNAGCATVSSETYSTDRAALNAAIQSMSISDPS